MWISGNKLGEFQKSFSKGPGTVTVTGTGTDTGTGTGIAHGGLYKLKVNLKQSMVQYFIIFII